MLGVLTGLTSTIVHELSKYGVDQIVTAPSEAELPHKSDMELNNTIPDNVLERLSDAEKLVVELKEIIQQKDLQLLQQDEVLQEERKAADTKIKKLKLHAKSKLVSLNKQMEKLKAQGEAASPMDPQAAEPLSELQKSSAEMKEFVLIKQQLQEKEELISTLQTQLSQTQAEQSVQVGWWHLY
ncbi:golgin subfamily B member 1-like [Onychomys torridus]|uniref:golgin subfamily B member 1-like n=1 Tax=Onychomys torridus TaxID=38674 RepID=UPI00167F39FD|nr:golgin subfamily B member 1-like [Onychomys torridus]XP_036032394.1 golgin subfamily B member 1-like [Onychomys torridus]XP_036032395.1 golgin subfamily B member 1-like [Onychomys torridus]